MTVRNANTKGIKFLESPRGGEKGGVALVTFDVHGGTFTSGSDTITMGGSGSYENNVSTSNSLATMIQNRRRDGKTVTLTGVCAGGVAPGLQAGVDLHIQAAAVSSGNIISMTLNTAPTGGSGVSATSAAWDAPAAIAVTYVLT